MNPVAEWLGETSKQILEDQWSYADGLNAAGALGFFPDGEIYDKRHYTKEENEKIEKECKRNSQPKKRKAPSEFQLSRCDHGMRRIECAHCRTDRFRPNNIGLKDEEPRFEREDPRSVFEDWDFGEAGIGVLEHSMEMSGFDRLISESCHKGTEKVNRLEPSEVLGKINYEEEYRPLPYFKDIPKVAQFAHVSIGQAAQLVWAFNSFSLKDNDRKKICLQARTNQSIVQEIFDSAKDLEENCVIPDYPVDIADEPDDRDEYEVEADSFDASTDVAINPEIGNELRAIPIGEPDSSWDWTESHMSKSHNFQVWFKGIQALASKGKGATLSNRFRGLFDGTYPHFKGKELTVLHNWSKAMLRKCENATAGREEALRNWIRRHSARNQLPTVKRLYAYTGCAWAKSPTPPLSRKSPRQQLYALQQSGKLQFTTTKDGQWARLWAFMNVRFPKKGAKFTPQPAVEEFVPPPADEDFFGQFEPED